MKRLESQTKSPIFNYISETLNGRAVLKASKLENDLVEKFMEVEDEHSSVFKILVLTRRWLAFRIEMVVAVTITAITILFVELSKTNPDSFLFSAGGVGTTINTFSNLLGLLGHGIKQSVETETNLTSVERLVHFAKLKSEKDKVSSRVEQVTTKDLKTILEPDESKVDPDETKVLDFNGDLKEGFAIINNPFANYNRVQTIPEKVLQSFVQLLQRRPSCAERPQFGDTIRAESGHCWANGCWQI